MKKGMRFTIWTIKLIILFSKILRNSHQNGAFWAHFEVLITIINFQFYNLALYEKNFSLYKGYFEFFSKLFKCAS